jgi:Mlc titration factor MtfA (ptsG expression regulator)
MSQSQVLLAVIVCGGLLTIVAILLWHSIRERRRAVRFSEPFPEGWRRMLMEALPLYRRMPEDLRRQIEPVVRKFLEDVRFVGCQGLQVTDEMRLIIAVQACLLIVARDPDAYDALASVLLYPDEFVVNEAEEDEAGVVHEGERVLAGQAFDTARIVLSWRDVQESAVEGDPYNVVLHEFAHYLDNSVDGTLTNTRAKRAALEAWHAVLDREYEALCDAVDRGEEVLIDPYATESTVEFFAVATEAFFETPVELQTHHPALYAELRSFYGLDPASW